MTVAVDPIMIGCAPSSGSTYLADLIDSTENCVCPPELYIFCVQQAYTFDHYFRVSAGRSDIAFANESIYGVPRPWFNRKYLHLFDLNDERLLSMLARSNCFGDFLTLLHGAFQSARMQSSTHFFEKTPVNIGSASRFLEAFPGGRFVEIVRNGYDVVASLKRRGFTVYEASLIWLFSVTTGFSIKSRRHVRITYENLREHTYDTLAALFKNLAIDTNLGRTERNYAHNQFRADLPRPSTWRPTAGALSKPITQTRRGSEDELDDDERAFVSNVVLHDSSQEQSSVLSFRDAMNALGYETQLTVPSLKFLRDQEGAYLYRRRDARFHPWRLTYDTGPVRQPLVGWPVDNRAGTEVAFAEGK